MLINLARKMEEIWLFFPFFRYHLCRQGSNTFSSPTKLLGCTGLLSQLLSILNYLWDIVFSDFSFYYWLLFTILFHLSPNCCVELVLAFLASYIRPCSTVDSHGICDFVLELTKLCYRICYTMGFLSTPVIILLFFSV